MSHTNTINAKRTALIDGDALVYPLTQVMSSSSEVLTKAVIDAANWTSRAFCEDFFIYFGGRNNFRNKVVPGYKAKRDRSSAEFVRECKAKVWEYFGDKVRFDLELEADDLLGIDATSGEFEHPIIVAVDKDMLQIPGWHFNPKTPHSLKDLSKSKECAFPFRVTEQEATWQLFEQLLKGDPTDNIPGLSNVGEVGAYKYRVDHAHRLHDSASAVDRAKRVFDFLKQSDKFAPTLQGVYIWRTGMEGYEPCEETLDKAIKYGYSTDESTQSS